MKNINVLITGAGAPGAPGIIKSLKSVQERKIRIIGLDMDKDAVGFAMVDKHYIIPQADDKNFIKKVFEIAKKEKIDVIIPLVTKELIKFAQNKDFFEKNGIKISISNQENLKIVNNKYFLMDICKKNDIPTPIFYLVKNYKDFEKAVFFLGYPKNNVCFKPPVSNGSRGFRILTEKINKLDILINYKPNNVFITLKEVKQILKNASIFPELIVMEYLPGEEYSIDILADKGKSIVAIPRLREKLKMGISFVGETVYDKEIIDYSKKVVKLLKLNGNIGLQFKRDKNNIPKIIESNPRVQGTIVLCVASGANLVYLAVKLALDEKIVKPKIKWNTKMVRYWKEIYYDKNGHTFTF